MKKDAFDRGLEPGGLYNSHVIKILVCYMLNGVGEPMPRQAVLEIIAGNGMANHFETGNAIDELIRHSNINENEDGTLVLTETGCQIADALSGMIPYTLRERSVKAALQLFARIRRERENSVKIEKLEKGFDVICTINDNNQPILTFSLRVADRMQAQLIRENFLNNPILLYRSLLSILTGNAHLTHGDTHINIDLK